MQEDLIVLLEWLNANGIQEFFEDNTTIENNNKTLSTIIKPTENKSFANVFGTIARQQNTIKHNSNILLNNIDKLRKIVDNTNNIEELINIINTTEYFEDKRKLANNTIVVKNNTQNNKNKILIINDLPNEDDDINNNIFYGESGNLLEKMFNAIDINFDSMILANSFFWRLAGGRTPIKEELYMCKPFVEKIISLIKPELIIFTGNYSVSTFLEENKTVVKTRGKFFDYTNVYLYDNIKATSLYSPNFIIKNQDKKKETWEDLKKIKNIIFK